MGELNSPSRTWDRSTNRNGHALVKWCKAHNFRIHRPPPPTLMCYVERQQPCGYLHSPEDRVIPSAEPRGRPIHRPHPHHYYLKSTLPTHTNQRRNTTRILQDEEIQNKIRQIYANSLPRWEQRTKQAGTPAELNKHVNGYIKDLLAPWRKFFKPKPGLFKPG